MSRNTTEKSAMSSVEYFARDALQNYIAPASVGPRKDRLRRCVRVLGWTYNRVNDVWKGDSRITIKARELVQIEEVTGLRYGRQELKEIDALISRSTALLHGQDEDFTGAFATALRAFYGALDRSRDGRGE